MFISRVVSKGKKGQSYTSILLRESVRIGKKVRSRTIAVLTAMPQWLIATIEQALAAHQRIDNPPGPAQPPAATLSSAVQALCAHPDSQLAVRTAQSFGAVFVVHELAKSLGIVAALGSGAPAKLALWQVLGRVLNPATSLLAMVRLAGSCAASSVLKLQDTFTEDDLYQNGAWLAQHQPRIEATLWENRSDKSKKNLFFYDVTSSYFEGQNNALSAYGYNRDGKKGKKQLVMGLLTDDTGEPMSVSLFAGNTNDLKTYPQQLTSLKKTFGCENITMVGDRGMLRGPQQLLTEKAGFHYISALHKAEIQTLLKAGVLQMEFFDDEVHQTLLEDGRRVVVRRNAVRQEEIRLTREGFRQRLQQWLAQANQYLQEHPKARVGTQLKTGLERLQRGGLSLWMRLEVQERTLSLVEDAAALAEASKLDGCYAIVSDLSEEIADAQTLHDRYKDLALVETDFRTLKAGHLQIRPWFVQREDNTRAHALTAMLALKIRRKLQAAWEPHNITVEEGLRTLEQLCVLEIYDKVSEMTALQTLPQPNPTQQTLLQALGITWPSVAPSAGPIVATRVKLQTRRKSNTKR
jgi:hypothetical protein